jgi:DNA modification methylase
MDQSPRNNQLERLSIADLVPDARNPRQHGKRQLRQISKAIRTFGFITPIVVDQENNIIAGHGRVLAAKQIGLNEVPAVRVTHLNSAALRAFAIADNRLNETSTWDDQILGEILSEISQLDLNFDLEATGFSAAEIDLYIGELSDGSDSDKADRVDAASPPKNEHPVSKVGDFWLLQDHRLLCADALDPTSYDDVLDKRTADVVFTDPPYNVRIHGNVSGSGNISHREFAMASGEMTNLEFEVFLNRICRLHAQYSANGSLSYFCMDWRHADALLAAGKSSYSELKNICVWTKSNAGMGSLYRSQHEFVFVFKNGRCQHRNNVELGKHGRNRSNVWNYPSPQSFGRVGEEGCLAAVHPTVKPVRLVADALLDCTARGDVVLDGFLGSGTTLIAAERTGRICAGIEIDPLYVDATIRRWQAYTGGIARHAVTSRSFNETAAEIGCG